MYFSKKQLGVAFVTMRSDYQRLPADGRSLIGSVPPSAEYASLSSLSESEDDALPKKTYPFENRQVLGEAVEFEATTEPWSQFKLADGSVVKVKSVLLSVVRLDEFTPQGDPVYQFQMQQIVGVVVPDSLKRKTQ